MADMLWQIYYGRYIMADTLWQIHCRPQRKPYPNELTATEALDRCIRILSLQRIFITIVATAWQVLRHLVGATSSGFGESKIYILQGLWHRSRPQWLYQMTSNRITRLAVYLEWWTSTPVLRQKPRIDRIKAKTLIKRFRWVLAKQIQSIVHFLVTGCSWPAHILVYRT